MPARWRLVTARAPGASAAIGVFHLIGDIDQLLGVLSVTPVHVGEARLRSFGGIDRGVAARPAPQNLLLMPHAGPAVLQRIERWLTHHGLVHIDELEPSEAFPEAITEIEARTLHALARAESPLAIEILLDQPRRWNERVPAMDEEAARRLRRLIDPPTVVAYGPPNIGKSTLLNTLAGRTVSIVADEPGTTRDHVGVRLDLAGLVVHFIDAPGIGGAANEIEREAQALARTVAANADLVLLCGESSSGFLEAPADVPCIRVGLRADLGAVAGADLRVSVAAEGSSGIETLVRAIRDALVPPALLTDARAWAFWEAR